ncbi:hypothetical protein K501DRAFT_261293 [Backusella circina FSU 941]|nr:hypothetical protein K501DRAFT_261293 [Backusella circina FSU 941]
MDPKFRRIQYYSRYYPPKTNHINSIPPTQWNHFWSANIPHTSRNVWYRLIYNSIPNHSLLNHRMPSIYKSPYCYLCIRPLHPPHVPPLLTNNHWFFDCPYKQIIWKQIWSQVFLFPDVSFSSLKSFVYQLQPIPGAQYKKPFFCSVSTEQVIAITLHNIWLAHWKWTFNKKVIAPTQTNNMIYNSIISLVKE